MAISYRTRQRLRRAGVAALTAGIVAVVVLFCLLLWLRRFVVYTDEGVKLEFPHAATPPAQSPQTPEPVPSVPIIFDDSPFQEGLSQLSGYYLDPQDLMKNPATVQSFLENLPAGTPVMLDLKGYRGYFYYPSGVGLTTSGSYDMEKMRAFLSWLTDSDLYVIARISTLRDFDYAYHDPAVGLPLANGALYSDRGTYGLGYWLNPANEKVQNYLIQIIRELRNLGNDEVVLQNFCFPDTDSIVFNGDKAQALQDAAEKIIAACRTEQFALSFSSSDPSYVLPDENCRLYLEDIAPSDAQIAWDKVQMENKRIYLVFLAPGTDTRYEIENGIMQTLDLIS